MPAMVELVLPVSKPTPEEFKIEAARLSASIIRVIDRVENIWDGPGGIASLRDAIQNIIGLARTKTEMWLSKIELTKNLSKEEQIPSQGPSNVVASVGNGNSNNPVPYTADRVFNLIKVSLSKTLSKQGTGGIRLCCVENARTILDLALQRVKLKYDCGEAIVHTDISTSSPA